MKVCFIIIRLPSFIYLIMLNKKPFVIIYIFSLVLWFGVSFLPALAEQGGGVPIEPILGCTDSTAENYNPEATEDDGSCTYPEPVEIEGCMDPEAENYNSEATADNGSCEYPVEGCTDSEAENYNPEATEDDGTCEYAIEGCTDSEALNYNPEATVDNSSCEYPESDIEGCTDPEAMNYNPEATIDDGTCTYPESEPPAEPSCDATHLDLCITQELCEGASLHWYNETCNAESELPAEPIPGCMGESAENYNPEATEDDDSCTYLPLESSDEDPEGEQAPDGAGLTGQAEPADVDDVEGCMDSEATNYNPEATVDNGSCEYAQPFEISGCTNPEAENYNPDATTDNGSCQYAPVEINGCTNPTAYNYNPDATIDNGSCQYPVVPVKPGQNFDPAIAPSKVTISVFMPDGSSPPFPVFVTFVGVGNKNFGGKINANGELTVTMPSGRYYTELMVINTEYIQGEDGPSFFLEANEERDFGAIRLIPKSEQDKIGQSLEDQTLEANILSEVEDSKGMGKILLLIVKLLIRILEEVRAIASQMAVR